MLDVAKMVDAVLSALDKPLSAMAARLKALEERQPEKGEKGDPGEPGRAGEDAPAPTQEQIVEAILSMPEVLDEAVKRYLAANPPPAGKDGIGLAGAIIDRDGGLVVTLTDGTARELGPVVGKDGEPGKPGRDGFSLEDFDATLQEDGRTIVLSFSDPGQVFKAEMGIPAMIYRGVFKDGQTYERGDTVTWGGSLWHCDVEETTEKPDSATKHWTLAAKRGKDGRDGVMKVEPEKKPVKVG